MPTLAELLAPEAIEALRAAPTTEIMPDGLPYVGPFAPPKPTPPIDPLLLECGCARRNDGFRFVGTTLVHKGCGSPRKDVALMRGARVQPRTMPCAGCSTTVTVAKRPDLLAQDLERERLVVCIDCAKSMSEGSTITVVSPAPKPKSQTGRAPAAVTISTTTKEKPLIDIDTLTDAELGAQVRETMKATKAEEVKPKAAKAKKAKKAKDKADSASKKADRKSLTSVGVLPAFEFKGVEVPALDVSNVANLDETPAAKHRSPYNKCRSRNGGETLHAYKDEPGIGVTACTWADLIADHQRFTTLAGEVVEAPKVEKAKAKPAKKSKAQIAAPIDLEERQVQALMATMQVSEKKARKMLTALSS